MSQQKHAADEPEYLVTTYRDGEIVEERMTRSEVIALDPADVDLHWDDTTGQIAHRRKSGESVEYFGSPPGVGSTLRRLLFDIMWQAPEMLDDSYVQSTTKSNGKPGRNLVVARLSKLRRALGESGRAPDLLLSRRWPFGICWNRQRSWRHIDWLATPDANGK